MKAILSDPGMLCTGFDDDVAAAQPTSHAGEEFDWEDLLRSVRTPGHC
jgi:hypothetical protein